MTPGQITLKRAMLATALIAVGCLGLSLGLQWHLLPPDSQAFAVPLAMTWFVWIGAGVGLLFGRWRKGAWVGVLLTVVWFLATVILSGLVQ